MKKPKPHMPCALLKKKKLEEKPQTNRQNTNSKQGCSYLVGSDNENGCSI
jgi:hypothetical protein